MLRCRNESIGTLIRFANCDWIVALFGFRGASSACGKESRSIFAWRDLPIVSALPLSGGRAFDQVSIAFLAFVSISQAGDLPVAADHSKCIFISPRHNPAFPTEEMSVGEAGLWR